MERANQPWGDHDAPSLAIGGSVARIVGVYVALASLWILTSDGVLARLVTDPGARVSWSIVKGWAFVAVTGLLLYLMIKKLTRQIEAQHEAILQGETKYRQIVRAAHEGIWIVDRDDVTTYANPRLVEMLGCPERELVGGSIGRFILPEDRSDHEHRCRRRMEGISETYERKLRRPDQTLLWVLISASPLVDTAGKVVGSLAMLADLSDRKRAIEALEISERRFRDITHNVPAMVFQAHGRGNGEVEMTYVSDHPLMLLPLDTQSPRPLFDQFTEAVAPADRGRFLNSIRAAVESGSRWEFEGKYLLPTGVEMHFSGVAQPRRKDDELIFDGLVLDVTERRRAEASLKESEELFRSLFEAGPVAAALLVSREFRRVNSLMTALTGFSEGELLGKSARLQYADDAEFERVGRELYGAVERDGWGTVEARLRRKNGEIRDVSLCARLLDSENPAKGMVVTGLDVTERKRAEQALESSRLMLEAVLEQSPVPVIVLSTPYLSIRHINRAAADFLGVSDEPTYVGLPLAAVQGRQTWRDLSPDTTSPDTVKSSIARMLDGETVRNQEFSILRKDGTQRWALASGTPVYSNSGQLLAILLVFADLTERKQAEEALRESQAGLESAQSMARLGSWSFDPGTRSGKWSKEMFHLFKVDPASGVPSADTFLEMMHPEDRPAFDAAYRRAAESGEPRQQEFRSNPANGPVRQFVSIMQPLKDASGGMPRMVGTVQDITERKELEANFLRAQRMEAIGALAAGIAHDLNNILAPILMSAPLLRAGASDRESREMVDTVESCAQRGADIIRQLLSFARGTPGVRAPLPIQHLLRDLDKIFRETFPRGIQFVVKAPSNLWMVQGDATQIHQALMNLCVNARDAMADGGNLTLAAENLNLDAVFAATIGAKPGPHVRVIVADTGTGIPPEHLDRIFDPFFTTKEIGKGTGLGLPTVLGIVRGHGGCLRVRSRIGKGTTFEIYLPASPQASEAALPQGRLPPPRARGELIVVVDDELSVREMIQRTLEGHGYEVATAAEGFDAMTLLAHRRTRVKAILTDMMMPGMDGASLVRALRQQEWKLPILGMTGLGEVKDIKGLAAGELATLLIKPFEGAELLAALHQALAVPGEKRQQSESSQPTPQPKRDPMQLSIRQSEPLG